MAGRINDEDVQSVKERTVLSDIVREHVTLGPGGVGRLKGLCPFHDEKTASFYVTDGTGRYHCFGCEASGDALTFLQELEHLSFVESVERLAGRVGMELRYEQGERPQEESLGRRSRLIDAHRVAQEFYTEALLNRPDARTARDFMRARGFNGAIAKQFSMGYSPSAGEELVRHLRARGFTDDEVVLAGLAGRGQRGLYDRFRGRLMWAIKDTAGSTIGFGARRIHDDDRIEAKYLNTSETPIYKKSSVLYGIDLARKKISTERQAVVVEGYTDVMACHLAGIENAVATCGTAFGPEHIKVLRRMMRDDADLAPARVVFTFDGDAAGQKAAMRAFADDQKWSSQSYVAVDKGGRDPLDLYLAEGAPGLQALIADAVPMFEFAVRTTIRRFDTSTPEGRVAAARAVAPIIGSIRDQALRPEYTREVAGWLGMDIETMTSEVQRAGRLHVEPDPRERRGQSDGNAHGPSYGDDDQPDAAHDLGLPVPDPRDPVSAAERQLLQVILQFPRVLTDAAYSQLSADCFTAPMHRAVYDGVVIARQASSAATPGVPATSDSAVLTGAAPVSAVSAESGQRTASGMSGQAWVSAVERHAPDAVRGLISAMAVDGLPTRLDQLTGLPTARYVEELVRTVRGVAIARHISDAISQLRRLEHAETPDPDAARALAVQLHQLQTEQAQLRGQEQ